MKRFALLAIFLLGLSGAGLYTYQATATVNDVTAANRYTANGSTTVFSYGFKILSSADIEVSVDNVAKTLTTDYTVSGVGASGGGSVTFINAPLNATVVAVLRKQPAAQSSTYTTNESFPSTRVERDFDKLVMQVQQLREQVARALSFGKKSVAAVAVDDPVVGSFARGKVGGGIDWATVTSAGSITIPVPVNQGGSGATTSTGSGSIVLQTSPTIITPLLSGQTDTTGDFTVRTASSPRLKINTTHGTNRTTFLDFQLNGSSKWLISNDQLLANVQYFRIYDGEAGLERLGIDSAGVVSLGAGRLAFPATQNPSANVNTLDDYEEFNWTPSLGGTASYLTQEGRGTKVGRLVCLNMRMTVNAIGTGSQTTIAGIPLAYPPSSGDAVFTVSNSASLAAAVVSITGHTANTETTITLRSRTVAAVADAVTAVLTSGSFLSLAGCYQSAT